MNSYAIWRSSALRNCTGTVPNCVTFPRRPVDATGHVLTIAVCVVCHKMFVCVHIMHTGMFRILVPKLEVAIL